VLVAIKDPLIAINIAALSFRQQNNLEKPIFLHLNDEMPWQQSSLQIQTQVSAYQQAFKVFRTVYYDAFQPYSSYIPVRSGALVTSSFLTPLGRDSKQYHSPESLSVITKASDRPVLCSFAGGLKYSHLGGSERQDRVHMIEAFMNYSQCDLFASDDTNANSHKLTKFEYLELMRGTVFVLCPTGLNPETQRPHQALELGAVPLTLRVPEAYQDYLSGIASACLVLSCVLSCVLYVGVMMSVPSDLVLLTCVCYFCASVCGCYVIVMFIHESVIDCCVAEHSSC
jgi:hypothetical protein